MGSHDYSWAAAGAGTNVDWLDMSVSVISGIPYVVSPGGIVWASSLMVALRESHCMVAQGAKY